MEKIGEGKQNILFLHGFGIRYNSYMPLIKELGKKYTVYLIDLPGHGHEKAVQSFELMVDRLEVKIKDLKLEKFIIIGHSLGGLCAYKLAFRLKNVTDVLLINPTLFRSRYSKVSLIWRFLFLKNARGIWIHHSLTKFYCKMLADFFSNIIIQNVDVFKTMKVLFEAMYLNSGTEIDRLKNVNVNIITSYNDSIVSSVDFTSNVKRLTQFVKGEHDWLMADVKKTTKIIFEVLDNNRNNSNGS